ncbi:hypothetical protein QBC40DRAFT_163067 [Triangularia verruculosa]|uniref:Uncharacterized protein n=1 Tax=Triangularia verruculosa TaxID=2587418 RepID=A0AAN6XRD7_9PEZI|nr:hypothetical protein QBC40DRAFT_163067 [Triangularia verruculosa]
MEPRPTKRPRLCNPLETEEDPLEDELLSLPSEINARRDPNLKLERSRQHAVFKLKSAFESIFERYGRDFEGVGDEIDLRTGRIVVNNGHIASLKGSELLEGGESEEEDEGEGDVGTREDAREGGEKGLEDGGGTESVIGQDPMLPQMMGFSGFGGWPGMMGGGPPGLSGTMFPGQMGGFNGWPMDYGPPMNMPTSDPTWQAPALPPSYMYGPGAMTVTPVVKKKMMALISPREDQGDSGDDDLLGVSAEKSGKEVAETPIKQRLLPSKPPPDAGTGKKRGPRKPPRSKVGTDAPLKQGEQNDGKKETEKEASPRQEDAAMREADSTTSKTTLAQADAEVSVQDTEPSLVEPEMVESDARVAATENDGPKATPAKTTVMPLRSRASAAKGPVSTHDSDLYLYMSDSEQKPARKPRNQSLRVEIVAKRTIDVTSFRAITPEQSETESFELQKVDVEPMAPTETTETPAPEEKAASQPARPPTPESEKENEAQPQPPEEVFTRHAIDAEYDFSDDEESLPRPKKQSQKKAGTSRKKDESLLRRTLRKPLSIVASTTETISEKPEEDVPMPDAGNLNPQESGLGDQASPDEQPTTVDLTEPSPQPVSNNINTESSIPDVMVRSPEITKVIYRIGNEETPWPKRRRTRSSFRGRDPRGEIPDSDPIGGLSTQEDLDDDIRPPSPSLSFQAEEDTTMEIPDSYIEQSSELEIPETELRRDHTVPSPTLSSHAPDEEVLGHISTLSLQPPDVEISESTLTQPAGTTIQESSDAVPDLSSQSLNSGVAETVSSPPPHTPHDNDITVGNIELSSSPLIPKTAQAAKEKPQLKLATPESLATPARRRPGRPPKTKPTPAGTPSPALPIANSTPTPSAKPTLTPSTKAAPKPSAKPTPKPSAKPARTPTTSTKPTRTPSIKPPSSSPTTTTATKRKRLAGVLSLLSDSEDDELSLLSPSIAPVTPMIRSSPASHHVRMLPYTSTPSLKRDALMKSSSKSRRLGGQEGMKKTGLKRVRVDEGVGRTDGRGGRCGEEGGCGRAVCFGCSRVGRGLDGGG